jgi:hypothetical protein
MKTFTLKASGIEIAKFDTAQDAMDWGNVYYKDGYTVA